MLRDVHVAVTGEILERPWKPEEDEDVEILVELMESTGHDGVLKSWVAEDDRALRLTATTPMASAREFMELAQRARDVTERAMGPEVEVTLGRVSATLLANCRAHAGRSGHEFHTGVLHGVRDRDDRPRLLALHDRGHSSESVASGPRARRDGSGRDPAGSRHGHGCGGGHGVIVDDSVHILYRLRRELARGRSFEESIAHVARGSGVAVVSTSLVFAAGFLVIALAGSDAVANPGLLTAVAVVAALLTDILLLPAFASFLLAQPEATQATVRDHGARQPTTETG